MRLIGYLLVFTTGYLLILLAGWTTLSAQGDTQTLFHEDVFGKPRRTGVIFSHDMHIETQEDKGCGVCHHGLDSKTGELVYLKDEEERCKECHGFQKEGRKPALREAYHGTCTGCHRHLAKSRNEKSGPTTCGECHKKELGT